MNEPADKLSLEATQSEDDDICPICLCPPSDELLFVKAPCQHEYCTPCIERILLNKQRPPPFRGFSESPDSHLAAPTKARCPYCRTEMTLFELKDKEGNYAFKTNKEIATSPISGLEYVELGRHDSSIKYTFPTTPGDLPSLAVVLGEESEPQLTHFDEGCYFHEKSNSFHGRLTWPSDRHGNFPEAAWIESTEVIFQFSSDFKYVAWGALIHKPKQNSSELLPLDGRWRVEWVNSGTAHIQVRCSIFMHLGFTYQIDTSNPRQPQFYWPSELNSVLQKALSGIDLEAQPKGPRIGQNVTWKTSPHDETIIWTRESFSSLEPAVEIIGPGARLLKCHNDSIAVRSMPTYHANALFGNTFCQALKVGLASYHFLEDETAYISYEHSDCGRWPPLDDGTIVPSRVPFRETHFDAETRLFRGKIKWNEDYATSWQGCSEWMYEMYFDVEYTCILSGRVLSQLIHGNEVPLEMSTYGFDLVYINAAVKDYFDAIAEKDNEATPLLESTHDLDTQLMRRYTNIQKTVRHRLQVHRASVRTIALMSRVLTAVYQPGVSNPIDFNL